MKRKTTNKRACMAILLMALLGKSAVAQQQYSFSAKQSVAYGLKNAVQVKNALLDVLIQEQYNRDVTSAALPQLSLYGGVTDFLVIPTSLLPGEIVGQPAGTYVPVKFGTKYNANAGVSFKQVLFDGQVFVGLQARKASMDLRKKSADITNENITANIYKVYYQLVVAKTQVQLLEANIVRLQKLSHDVTEIYKNGFAEKLDVDKLTVQMANLQTEKVKVLNSITNGYNGLKVLMGMPIKDSLVLTDSLNEEQLTANILTSTEYKYSDRSEFQALELTKELNAFNIKRFKLSRIPILNLEANYAEQAQRSKFDFFKGSRPWFATSYVGVNLSVPLFRGFSLTAKIAQAKLSLQQTQNQLDFLKISIDNDVAAAKNNFATAIASIAYQRQNIQLAELVYNQTKKKYEVGTGSATEINTAQVDLKTAQTNYVSALYDAIIARIDLLKAVGQLNHQGDAGTK